MKKNYLLVIGIILPLILIFSFQSYIETAFGQYKIWIMGLFYFVFITWSIREARSQKKFFNKNQDLLLRQIDESRDFPDFEKKDKVQNDWFNLGHLFFIQSAANFLYFLIWWTFIFAFPDDLEVSSYFYVLVFAVGFCVFFCNLSRVLMTSKIFDISLVTSLNSLKFILIHDIILYGFFGTYFALIGGLFL